MLSLIYTVQTDSKHPMHCIDSKKEKHKHKIVENRQ